MNHEKKQENLRLTPRDYAVLREVDRWRFLLGRHIKALAAFPSTRVCDRRLSILVSAGYLKRQKVLYGIPSLYTLTHKGKMLLGQNKRLENIQPASIAHDVLVLDALVFLMNRWGLTPTDITSERELHQEDGFSTRKHCPDFVFSYKGKKICVEIELSHKAVSRIQANLKQNYLAYDGQLWVIPSHEKRNHHIIQNSGFEPIQILESDVIQNSIKNK